MDYFSDADPLISSAIYSGVLDFDPYSRTRMILEDSGSDIPMSMDSPDSMETYNESEIDLTFQDSSSVSSVVEDVVDSVTEAQQKDDDTDIEVDRRLVIERFAPYDLFPADNIWTLEERVEKLLYMSPCKKYSKEDLLHIDSVESPDKKVDMLIEVVSKVHVNHRWNYVHPHELHRGYTVVTNCKKEKKKDSDGHLCPKRPMNAFMIWSMKCRALIAQITPQLHNAIISTKLGAAWRKFNDEEKAIYEREKDVLATFHKFEFPDYKYKPKKKAKKADDKLAPETKQQRCCKRKRSDTSPASPLQGISIADASQNLDPLLRERLIMKMQIKIDPLLKKGIGKRMTAIDFSDLSTYQQTQLKSSHSLPMEQQLPHRTSSSNVNIIIDSKPPSVFDTPENSPNKISPPGSPTDDSLGYDSPHASDRRFQFDDDVSLPDSPYTDDSVDLDKPAFRVKSEPDLEPSIKTEPNIRWNLKLHFKTETLEYFGLNSAVPTIKTEPLEYPGMNSTHASIKTEPELICLSVPTDGNIPVLSAETVESVLDNDCVSSFNNEELLDDFMKYLDNDICLSSDLLPFFTALPEGLSAAV